MERLTREFSPGFTIRLVPYPYQALFAICSDLDETPDRQVYFETMRFLNTGEDTMMGPGVNLEVGNTIYFDMPPEQFAYWNTDDQGRSMVRDLIRSGHIDCLHSFGDLATTRAHAGRALEELDLHGCHVQAWVDHGTAITNFDGDIMQGCGDLPGSPAYHADLTRSYGIEYVWKGRVTSVVGQNAARSLGGIWLSSRPFRSGKTLLKEWVKGVLAKGGNVKYAMHRDNRVLRNTTLRDGQKVKEFMRCNPHWGGVSCCETASGVAQVLTPEFLDRLITRQAICILYTHLGKVPNREEILPDRSRAAFAMLAVRAKRKDILVATTRRLLGYCRMLDEAVLHVQRLGDRIVVDVSYPGPSCDLDGLTLQGAEAERIMITHNGKALQPLQFNLPDESGKVSVSVPWSCLEFPQM